MLEMKNSRALEILACYLLLQMLLVVVGFRAYNYYNHQSLMLENIISSLAIFNFLLTLFVTVWLSKAQSFQSRIQIYKKSLGFMEDALNIMGAVSISNLKENKYIDVNESFIRMFGYSREEVLGRTPMELNLWVKPQEQTNITKIIVKNGTVRNKEMNFLTKGGKIVVGLVSAEIISIGGEKCILTVVGDITERKFIQNEMVRLDRLNIVGEMAVGIAHEVRNPMTTVRGFLQMLGEKKDIKTYKDYFDLMIEELDRANHIIGEYLSLTRDSEQHFSQNCLNNIIDTLEPLLQADAFHAQKYIQVDLGEIPSIYIDEKQIRQLILNLVRNGVEATSSGGAITIKTYQDGDEVVLAIKDEGSGIEPENLQKIGKPFFTTKENGTGLGLSTCYRIAACHSADIQCETGSQGTTFFVRFKHGIGSILS